MCIKKRPETNFYTHSYPVEHWNATHENSSFTQCLYSANRSEYLPLLFFFCFVFSVIINNFSLNETAQIDKTKYINMLCIKGPDEALDYINATIH